MSKLNTLFPNDSFLKNISNSMGKVDSKSEIQIKQEIEQIGYREFYRYYNERYVRIKQLKEENEELKLQNFNLREDIMIQKKSLPNKEIKDKTFYNLLDIPSYEELKNQQKEFIKYLENEIYKHTIDIQNFSKNYNSYFMIINNLKESKKKLEEILSKYKEIVGGVEDEF